jgi:hypothetical protein
VVFLDQIAVLNVLVRVQVNHLSAVLLTILLLPCLLKAASSGTSSNPRVVIVASDVHYWTMFSKAEVEREKILRKLSDKDRCTSPWGHSLLYLTVVVTPYNFRVVSERYKIRNICKQSIFARLADSERFPVLNIFFVLELTKSLPANSPVIVTAVNPGLCRSLLKRNISFTRSVIHSIIELLLARTTEEGSRQLVWAAVGGAGRESELRGGFVSNANLQEISDYVLSDEGAVVQTRLWVGSRHPLS